MDFNLTEDDLMIQETAADLAAKKIYPNAEKWDEEGKLPQDILDEMAELGYFGMLLPEKYDGLELSTVTYNCAMEELSAACAGLMITISVHNSLCCEAINKFGSEELKDKYLPNMAAGKIIGAYCLTEPNAGTDAASIKTSAVKKGDKYVLNGTKTFVTNGGLAGVFIVFAVTDPEKGSKGISCFVVPKDTPGIDIGAPEKKMGMKASDTREVSFTDVEIDAMNIIGAEGSGFKTAVILLNNGRIGVAFQAIGIARAAFEEALKYSKERKQFGRSLSSFQAIQFKLADMAAKIDAGRLLAFRAAWMKDNGVNVAKESSMAKLVCSQACNWVVNEAVQIHGGYGYMKEYAVERYFRDARVTEIYEGTTEAQKMVISRQLLRD
ncbi:MAG: acyl-CoA dehydrogenase family protein [candidate division Zixibacteria bacterium]|nr:acyl-CoA dehydrogenase family protein [candidate division Zixibacteria bacterium]